MLLSGGVLGRSGGSSSRTPLQRSGMPSSSPTLQVAGGYPHIGLNSPNSATWAALSFFAASSMRELLGGELAFLEPLASASSSSTLRELLFSGELAGLGLMAPVSRFETLAVLPLVDSELEVSAALAAVSCFRAAEILASIEAPRSKLLAVILLLRSAS